MQCSDLTNSNLHECQNQVTSEILRYALESKCPNARFNVRQAQNQEMLTP